MSALWDDPIYGPLARELYRTCGLVFEGGQAQLFRKRVERRAREAGWQDLRDYVAAVSRDSDGREYEHLLEQLTVNETYFFREEEHFRVLLEEFWPQWRERGDDPIRFWSAAASTGCEPYTLAILLRERGLVGAAGPRVEILATDVNGRVLAEARQGDYFDFALRNTSAYYRAKYFRAAGGGYRLDAEVRRMVSFAKYNLQRQAGQGGLGGFHAVLCRNVLIYFDVAAKRRAVAALTRALRPGGVLIVGRSESLFNVPEAPPMVNVGGVLVYRKAF